jgi:superfamily II DNA/RNA helicase
LDRCLLERIPKRESSESLFLNLKASKYVKMTEIQSGAIPLALAGVHLS